MRVLVAEDEITSMRLLETLLERWGYEVVSSTDGESAWAILQGLDAPTIAVLDWMMPELDGAEICRRLRQRENGEYVYVVMVSAKEERQDVIAGLQAGADDYLTKPFEQEELHARLRTAQRIVELQRQLRGKVSELEKALREINQLRGIIPICMHCHRIRDEKRIWQNLEQYIQEHSGAVFSHALCEECLAKYYPPIGGGRDSD